MTSLVKHVLVDGNNLLHRAAYVFVALREKNGEPPLLSPGGYPVGLIFGALSILSDWVGSISKASKISMFLDGIPKRRLAMDPAYKLREDGSPSKLRRHDSPIVLSDGHQSPHDVDVFSHVMRLLGADVYFGPEEEADDLIASFVASRRDDVHVIISSDKDFYQILSDNVVLYRPGLPGNRFFDSERATSDMERVAGLPVPPGNVRMFKSLIGDPSDNIPGVPRLRKKIAASVSHHVNPSKMYESGLLGFSNSERERTLSLRDRVELNFRLVGMNCDLDLREHLQASLDGFETGVKIIREDLGMSDVSLHSFRLQSTGRSFFGPPVPDWLADI